MKNNIKVVVIESPYDTYQDSKEVRDLMGRVWKMKLDGYKLHYPYGIMPVSEIDFFANHVILCEEIQGELFPFAGSRSISTTQCKKSRIEFPVIEHLFQSISKEAEPLLQATKNWINNKEKKNEIIGYNSSWTMCPRVLESDHLKTLARDLSMAMYYYYYTSYNIPNIITAAASRFKVDRIQKEMGFEYVKDEFNNNFSDFTSRAFFEQKCFMMILNNNQFPLEFIRKAKEFKKYWDNRVVFEDTTSVEDFDQVA